MAEAKSGLMAGKRGLVMGVANDHSIAWGIAQMLAGQGAEIAFTYQGDAQAKRLKPLAASIGSDHRAAGRCRKRRTARCRLRRAEEGMGHASTSWSTAIAFSDRDELKGRYVDTSRANFARTLDISCYSFTAVAQRAAQLMPHGGALVTLTYLGAQRVMPNYNVMGVAKAALEASPCAISPPISARTISASTPSRPGRCAPWRARRWAMPAWCSNGTRPFPAQEDRRA